VNIATIPRLVTIFQYRTPPGRADSDAAQLKAFFLAVVDQVLNVRVGYASLPFLHNPNDLWQPHKAVAVEGEWGGDARDS
jgi:hypothetical protein